MSDGVIRRARDHYFVIGGRPSSDFGIVCSSDNGFDAPARDVETISVQGRNGDLHIDKGRWENVSVTYTCTIERDFVRKFGEFRKFISSLRGYQRLEDTFHPGEYRMASLNGGIEVDKLGTRYNSGTFDLTFNCKPQRFLKSGEEPITIIPPISSAGQLASPKYTFPNDSEMKDVAFQVLNFGGSSVDIDVIFYDTNDEAETSTYTITRKGEHPTIETPVYPENYTAWRIIARTNTDYLDNLLVRVIGYAVIDGETKYLDSTFARTFSIDNPTGFECRPMVEFIGGYFPTLNFSYEKDGDSYLYTMNGYSYADISNVGLVDCENEYVYAETEDGKVNLTGNMVMHTYVSGTEAITAFPRLGEGTTTIYTYSTTEGLSDSVIYLYPHWFTI